MRGRLARRQDTRAEANIVTPESSGDVFGSSGPIETLTLQAGIRGDGRAEIG